MGLERIVMARQYVQRDVPVRIKNGDLESTVLPSAVVVWLKRGWTLVDDGDSETDSVEQEVAPEPTPEKATKKRASATPSNEEE